LFGGLVLGDDRYQPADLETSFRASGLTHLLAVSGQNVVFVLTVAAPLLRRLRLWPRLAATLAVLGFFALVTRFEPSVLRAVAMASAAAVAATLGRPASSVRLLALAVTGLILVDPLLVHQVGFQLSVLATAGIVVLARPLNRLLPLPPVLALPLSVTLAAQLATGPLLAFVFGPVPLAAVPANLLAEPVAGAAMVYGLAGGATAGVASYVVGPGVASLVHLPTRAMLWWLAGVASRSARLPLGHLGLRPLCLLLLAAVVAALRRAPRRERRSATVAPAAGSGPRDPPGRGVPP
jgi:competence protein ComEC